MEAISDPPGYGASVSRGPSDRVEIYGRAEQTDRMFYLIIQTKASTASIEKVQLAQGAAVRNKRRAPEIKIVDGRIKNSASHADEAA